ncbi:meiotic recombination protein SPO11-1 [Nymphaea colorata]|nr:meiotic recombination protein SPO11-1 [Nymphaea colorata]
MAEGSPSSKSFAFLCQIKEFTRNLVKNLSRGNLPVIALDRYRSYCNLTDPTDSCCCSGIAKKKLISMERASHAQRLDVLLRVLLIIQQLLQENKHASKRDIYYMHPTIFTDQETVDRAINDICSFFRCSRHDLNVVSANNGLVMGWLRFVEAEHKFDCATYPNTGYPIPVQVEKVKNIISTASYILVVEKETVFQRLADDKFCQSNRCIVLTGRGYPDVSTRRFLRLLIDELHLPAYCLVDCDPYGFEIMMTYRFGSMQMAFDAKSLCIPELRAIGTFPSDLRTYHLPDRCLLPLTPRDRGKAKAMLQRCYLHQQAPELRSELQEMLQCGVKFEMEALCVTSFSILSEEYIPSKIEGGMYI